jgi:glycosyltransferase involved in cell wall biosynthesis
MCTHNSGKLLPVVLPQISRVIPIINRKFIVDDFSTDDTKAVAQSLGWQVFSNKKMGLNNARRYAFSLVETECCASFEHDVYLADNWFPTIPNHVQSGRYDVAQGIRIRDAGGFREADIYDYNHRFIPSEDNTFYRMGADFSNMNRYCIDKNVCSRHLRGGMSNSLRHDYSIYRDVNSDLELTAGISPLLRCLVNSPFLSIKVFRETKGTLVLFAYPMERLMALAGGLSRKMKRRTVRFVK